MGSKWRRRRDSTTRREKPEEAAAANNENLTPATTTTTTSARTQPVFHELRGRPRTDEHTDEAGWMDEGRRCGREGGRREEGRPGYKTHSYTQDLSVISHHSVAGGNQRRRHTLCSCSNNHEKKKKEEEEEWV